MCQPRDSECVRANLVEALKLDLVGPDNNHAFAHELLSDAPSRWYLSGFLVLAEAPVQQKSDETSVEETDSGGDTDRELQFILSDILKVPPISKHGNVAEIAQHFGGL